MTNATLREVDTTDLILNEIFMNPSAECIENRFQSHHGDDNFNPGCSGKCKSPGGCITYLP